MQTALTQLKCYYTHEVIGERAMREEEGVCLELEE